jgi:hypothetical protein
VYFRAVHKSGFCEHITRSRIWLHRVKLRARELRQRRHVDPDIRADFENARRRRSGHGGQNARPHGHTVAQRRRVERVAPRVIVAELTAPEGGLLRLAHETPLSFI